MMGKPQGAGPRGLESSRTALVNADQQCKRLPGGSAPLTWLTWIVDRGSIHQANKSAVAGWPKSSEN